MLQITRRAVRRSSKSLDSDSARLSRCITYISHTPYDFEVFVILAKEAAQLRGDPLSVVFSKAFEL